MTTSVNATLSPGRSGDSRGAGDGQIHRNLLVSRVLHPIKVAYIEALPRIGLPISPSEKAQISALVPVSSWP